MLKRWIFLMGVLAMLGNGHAQGGYYVATNGTAPYDGAGWATAFTNLQQAVDSVAAGDTLYLAGQTFDLTAPLIWSNKNLSVLGGFAANPADAPGPRDPDTWPTVLQREAAAVTEYRVMHIHGLTEGVLDGVTIRNGHAPTTPDYQHGGGMWIVVSTNLALRNCVIRDNRINADYSGYGAGIASINSSIMVSNVQVIANSVDRTRNNITYYGGGMYLSGGNSVIRDSVFRENRVAGGAGMVGYGSGMFISGGTHSLTNVLLAGNRFERLSGGHRGALAINAGTVTARNLTVLHNTGSAIYRVTAGTLNIGSSIVCGNGAAPAGTMSFEYSNVQGGVPSGTGNLSADPLFERGIYLATNSLCVDGGGITVAVAGLEGYTTRADGTADTGTVDMGYHFKSGLDPAVANLYVSVDGSDTNDGDGPDDEDAFRTVTKALSVAQYGSRIHIGAGTFDVSGGESFPLVMDKFGLQLIGAGSGQTVLDAGGVSNRVISAHLVIGDGMIRDLTVTRGRSLTYLGNDYYAGGGILLDNSAMRVEGVHAVSNRLDANYTGPGAGIAAVNGGTLTLRDSVIAHNFLKGRRNDIDYFGGGLYVAGVPSVIERVVVFNNTIEGAGNKIGYGAGIYLGAGTHQLSNMLIASNSASNLSGGRFGVGLFSAATAATRDRITLADNSGGDGIRRSSGTLTLRNSIAWNNGTELTAVAAGDIWYSIVKDYPPIPAQGVSSNNPLFADRLHYHLQSQTEHVTGGWFSGGSWTTAAADSPGIDAGDPAASAWEDEPYPHGGRLNIGAYAGSAVAAKSPPLSVVVLDPTAVTPDSAVLRGELLHPGGSDVEFRFYYGTSDGETNAGSWLPPTALTTVPGNRQLSASVSDLSTGTPYFYRVQAQDAEGGVAWSPTAMEFTPSLALPVLGDLSVSNPAGPSVTLHGEIVSTGGDTPHVFVFWGPADGGTNALNWQTTIDLGVTAGPIEEVIVTEQGSNYWFSIMISNSAGVVWAEYARPFGFYNRLFVAADAAGRGTGYNWPDALTSLPAAFAACDPARTNIILLKGGVAGGSFVAAVNPFLWNRSNVRIYGGYQGTALTGDGARDPDAWPTLLTRNPADPPIRIMEIIGVTNGILDGVTVTGGHADPWDSYASGGGVLVSNSVDLLIAATMVTNNLLDARATGQGSTYTGRGAGLAAFNSSVTITGSLIADNFLQGRRNDIDYHGGGVYVSGGGVAIADSIIVSNRMVGASLRTARGAGLALVNGGSHRVRNTLIATNTMSSFTTMQGQGISVEGATTTVTIENVTIAHNEREGLRRVAGTVTATNTIIWGHSVADIDGTVTLGYSCVGTGGNPGNNGNIDDDPLFVNPGAGNFRLQTQHGRLVGEDWVNDAATSPAIDAGTALDWITAEATDLDGNLRLVKGLPASPQTRVDMGAYEMAARIRGTIFVIR